MSGYCVTGMETNPRIPKITMIMEIAVERTGRLIKLSNFIILIHSKSFVHVLPLSGDCLLAFGCRFSRGDCFDGHTVSHGCSHSFNHDAVPDV